MYVVIAYDIVCDKRRQKVEKEVASYGRRVNYSVFELDVGKSELDALEKNLVELIKPSQDSVRIYPLDMPSALKAKELGKRAHPFKSGTGYVY